METVEETLKQTIFCFILAKHQYALSDNSHSVSGL